jgi:predicted alpha/beta-fold hydrolase
MNRPAEPRPAWWLPGPHLQTIWGPVMRARPRVVFEREVIETADGDEVVLDHLGGSPRTPRVLLLHGLEGSSYSFYVQAVCGRLAALGYRATVMHFRSCARDPDDRETWIPNRTARLYYSGDTADFDFAARLLRSREPDVPLLALGVSIGGNVLLKWLGEHPGQSAVRAAATISVPYDLAAGARHLGGAIGRFYTARFLRTLKPKVERLAARFPELRCSIDLEGVRRAREFWAFDDASTAPIHGFANAADYYERCSSIRFVGRIETPTLCLSAEDDPFLPRHVLAELRTVAAAAIEIVTTRQGGHVGFVTGHDPRRPGFWAEEFVVDWLLARSASRGAEGSSRG